LCGVPYINDLLAGNRTSMYGELASISATLLGFALTVVSIILVFSSDARLAVVTEHGKFSEVITVYFDAIKSLGAATIVTILALIFDRDKAPSPFFFCIVVISSNCSAGLAEQV